MYKMSVLGKNKLLSIFEIIKNNSIEDAKKIFNKNKLIVREIVKNGVILVSGSFGGIIVKYFPVIESEEIVCILPPKPIPFESLADEIMPQPDEIVSYMAVEDGTIITFYFNEGWHIATYRGVEMENIPYIGNLDGEEHSIYDWFIDVAERTCPGFMDNYETKFDKKYSYTFGFRNHKIHPFLGSDERIWLVNKVKNSDMSIDVDPVECTCMIQKFTDIKMSDLLEKIKEILEIDISNSINLDSIKKYGIIFKSSSTNYLAYFRTKLLKKIIKFFYKFPYEFNNNNFVNRSDFTSMRAFLDEKQREIFLLIFPQFKERFNSYSNQCDKIIEDICNNNSLSKKDKDYVRRFLIDEHLNLKFFNPLYRKQVREFVYNSRHAIKILQYHG